MNVSLRSRMLTLALAGLSAASLACGSFLGGPTPPASPIVVSTEAAGELEDLWQNAIDNAVDGQFSVVMTEEQLTSYVSVKLAEQEEELPLEDVQIFLRNGNMTMKANAKIGAIVAPATIDFNVTVNAEGKLEAAIEDADFGPVPVPDSMLESLNESINESLTNELTINSTEITLESIAIADGKMSVSGTVNN